MTLNLSIITPSLNHGPWISQTIESVRGSSGESVEHIIIDGVSTDQTLEILKKYPHLIWISEKDGGRTDALNKGLKLAKGEVLGWLCTDDYYLPGALKKVASYFSLHPEADVLAGRAKVVDEGGNFLFDQEEPAPEGYTHPGMIRFWKYPMLPQPSVFFRRRVLEEAGYLDESLKSYMDYEFFLRLSQRYVFHRIPEFLSCIRFHDRSESVEDLASGRLDDLLLPISQRFWGHSGFYFNNQISYFCHKPGRLWRAYYEKFVFEVRRALGLRPREMPKGSDFWKIRSIFLRYPLPFLVAVMKQMIRWGNQFLNPARTNQGKHV